MLTASIVLITSALIAYTTGVWAEHRSGTLRWWHVVAFGAGLTCDASGTAMMAVTAASPMPRPASIATPCWPASWRRRALALALMALHLGWAIVTMIRNNEATRRRFHKFSLVVWSIWLVPYITGMLAAML